MQTFESAAELDKALNDGSFENIDPVKPEVAEKEEQPELNLTPEEKEAMSASTSILEAAQQLDSLAAIAQEKGMGALYRAISERAATYHVRSMEAHSLPPETSEALMRSAQQELENFQFSLRQHEEARQQERIAGARNDVDEVLESITPPQSKVVEREVPTPDQAWEPVEVPYLRGASQTIDAFKDLLKEAKGKKSKYVTAMSKTYIKSFANQYKQLEKTSKTATTLEQRNEVRKQIEAEAASQWKRLKETLELG